MPQTCAAPEIALEIRVQGRALNLIQDPLALLFDLRPFRVSTFADTSEMRLTISRINGWPHIMQFVASPGDQCAPGRVPDARLISPTAGTQRARKEPIHSF